MIAKITLENFFSFGSPTTIVLNPGVNILVGINGSGKSNFLKAIRLLKEGIVGEGFEKIFLKDWSGFNSAANFSRYQKDYIRLCFEFDREAIAQAVKGYAFYSNPIYEITINRSGSASYYLKERLYNRNPEEIKRDFMYLDIENSHGYISTREDGKVSNQKYPKDVDQIGFKSTELALRQISDPNSYYPLFTIKTALEKLSIYDYFDTTLKGVIREPGNYGTEETLLPDGGNLTSILNRIKNHHSLEYEKIEDYIKKINPQFKDIGFDILGSKLYPVLREQLLSKAVSIEHISDGTLRYLLHLSILFNPERGNVICMDEPETGLHPDMINSIADLLKYAAKDGTQLIVATHSPLLLNSFDLDDLLIFEKDGFNQTIINQKSEEDFKDWNDDFLTGQLWLRGMLGGKRW